LVIDFRQLSFILNSVCVVRRVMPMGFAPRGKICYLRVRFFQCPVDYCTSHFVS